MEVKAEVPRLEYIAVSLKCEAEEPVPIAACARLCAPLGDLAPGVKLEEADKDPLDRGMDCPVRTLGSSPCSGREAGSSGES